MPGPIDRPTITPTPHRVPRALESGTIDPGWITFVQATDPGAVGPTFWIDTSGGSGNYVLYVRNASNTGWEPVISGGAPPASSQQIYPVGTLAPLDPTKPALRFTGQPPCTMEQWDTITLTWV